MMAAARYIVKLNGWGVCVCTHTAAYVADARQGHADARHVDCGVAASAATMAAGSLARSRLTHRRRQGDGSNPNGRWGRRVPRKRARATAAAVAAPVRRVAPTVAATETALRKAGKRVSAAAPAITPSPARARAAEASATTLELGA